MTIGVIILGAGGHAKVVIELLRANRIHVGYCVANSASGPNCLGVDILAGDAQLEGLYKRGYRQFFPAVGDNMLRRRLSAHALELGFEMVNAIGPRAVVSPSCIVGRGVAIMEGVIINAATRIADLAIVNTGSTVDHDCDIGMAAHVAPNCALAGGVRVGEGAFVGAGSVIIPGVDVGDYSVIGAGSVVLRDVPGSVVAYGNPARVVKRKGD
jgi:UDP-perosamine 4-acetyltransferase